LNRSYQDIYRKKLCALNFTNNVNVSPTSHAFMNSDCSYEKWK